ncbi:MAG: CatB-related O-acetyltransferase [Sedimentisphaerales bacterium]|nr:CatB-related O-acetyltransferase [Sedimentisphaerales bacterium]
MQSKVINFCNLDDTIETNFLKLDNLLGPYNLRLENDYQNWKADIGRFSSRATKHLSNSIKAARMTEKFHDDVDIELGSFVQFGGHIRFLVGGEHYNHKPINVTLSNINGLFAGVCDDLGYMNYSKGPIKIGHGVILSHNVTILSGVTIGDGAVIGANALVNRDIPPFAIAGGVPARVLKFRFEPAQIIYMLNIRWWDFELEFLAQHLQAIHGLDIDEFIEYFEQNPPEYYDGENKRFVLKTNQDGTLRLTGYTKDGRFVNVFDDPKLMEYLKQLQQDTFHIDDMII